MKDSKEISLFIDTATKAFSIGGKKGNTVAKFDLGNPKKALERTHLGISLVCEALSIELKDVDSFYCLLGPGSNTGIRLGLTIPKTIYALNPSIKMYGIKTMDLFTINNLYACLSDRNGNLFYANKKDDVVTYERIDKADISSKILADTIVVEDKDEMAISELEGKNLIKINVLNEMMSHADAFVDFSKDEENYLPEYILKI